MDTGKLHEWLQVVGLFGVIASLIFVGLQMKQDRDIALSAATQARTETTIQNIMGSSSNPILASAIDKIELGENQPLLPSEERALGMMGLAVLFNLENVHYQYQSGYVSEERWVASRQTLKGLLRPHYGARARYEADPGQWRESFQQIVEELLKEIDSEETDLLEP
jgi:hypothetical protein